MSNAKRSTVQPNADSNVRVMARVRLFSASEVEESEKKKELLRPCIRMRDNVVTVVESVRDGSGRLVEREKDAFQFDEAFWSMPTSQFPCLNEYATQEMVYNKSGKLALNAAITGYNVCIFAYGQTGSGKTYSMLGSDNDPGISPRLVDELFATTGRSPAVKTSVELTFFEVYNEKCRDLFLKKGPRDEYDEPKIRTHPKKGVYVEGLTRKEVSDAASTKRLIARGIQERTTAPTGMNAESSRSHAIFQITITQIDGLQGTQRVSTINLVDLAGSERTDRSNVAGEQLKQANYINLSLSTLRRVIDALIDNAGRPKKSQQLPPFRESVLTRVLQDSLGGNSKTQMIATLSPHVSNLEESIGSLRYALRARAIVCSAKVNEEKSDAVIQSLKDELLRMQILYREGAATGVGCALPPDVKAEMEEKEAELHKLEGVADEMKTLLDQAKQNEVHLAAQIEVLQEQHGLASVTLKVQQAKKFAEAFRTAFRLGGERRRVEELEQEVQRLRHDAEQDASRTKALEGALQSAELRAKQDVQLMEERVSKAMIDIAARDATIAQLRMRAVTAETMVGNADRQVEALRSKAEESDRSRCELEKALLLAQQDFFSTRADLKRAEEEWKRQEATFEQRLSAAKAELENCRKRKEYYKGLHAGSASLAHAGDAVVSALQTDRSAVLDALKCQHLLVKEHGENAQRARGERDAAESRASLLESKLARQDQEINALRVALREYQAAALEWSYESNRAALELRQLSAAHSELRLRLEDAEPQLRPRATSANRNSPPTSRRN